MNSNFDRNYTEHLANMLWNKYANILERSRIELDENNKSGLKLDINKKGVFLDNFCNRYKYILENYMETGVKSLDRHKVASIAIIEFILADVLIYIEPPHDENTIFMPKYYLAAQTGLAFMQYWFNNLLEIKGITPIIEWHWPKMLSCPKKHYFSVFSRNLYFVEQKFKDKNEHYFRTFNELELSDKLFLFEYATILKHGIDPDKLVEEDDEEDLIGE
jgi:hypothetical protein